MPLVAIDTFRDLLACPKCGSSLTGSVASLVCSHEPCGRNYPAIGNPLKPILIDSDASIVDVTALVKSDGAAPVDRAHRGRLQEFVMRRILVRNETAEDYVHQLAEDLVVETEGRPRVLVIGGGAIGNGIEALYEDSRIDLLAFDIYNSDNIQLLADGHQLPFKSKSIDGVVIQAVLEHVLNPQLVVDEIYRVLRLGGLVYADTPFMYPVHEGPYDFTRFTESGHRYLFRHFTARNSGVIGGLGTQLLLSLIYFSRGISYRLGQMVYFAFGWLPKLDHRLDSRVTIDGASSIFFYGHSSLKIISPAEIVSYYSGAQVSQAGDHTEAELA
jgi:SAM-dependent methyltransferase